MRNSNARVLLVGQGPTAESAFAALSERFNVSGLVRSSNPDDVLIPAARRQGAKVFCDATVGGVRAAIAELDPDVVVVSSFDRILSADLVSERPFINVHYAPLPRYRGRAVVNWAIINGESETAISIHCLEPELDAGGILFQELVPIGKRDTVTELYKRLNAVQRGALASAVERRLDGDVGVVQDESAATYACTRLPSDGEILWSSSAEQIDRLIRALCPPFPGAFTWLGMERIIIDEAEPLADSPTFSGAVPGRVASVDRSEGTADVLTGDGVLRVYSVQRESGIKLPAASVFSSVRMTLGLSMNDLLGCIQELQAETRLLRG